MTTTFKTGITFNDQDEIEEEEFISGVIGDQEDEEQLRILKQEENRKR